MCLTSGVVNDTYAAKIVHIVELIKEAHERAPDDLAAAGLLWDQALGQTEALLADRPGDLDLLSLSVGVRYDLARVRNARGDAPKAVTLLGKAEQECAMLIAGGATWAWTLLADVLSRRAHSHQLVGSGASAVIYSDRAVSLCRLLRRRGEMSDADLGRILAFNSRILAEFGDPVLAMNSVRESGGLLAGEHGDFTHFRYGVRNIEAADIVRTGEGGDMALLEQLAELRSDRKLPRAFRKFAKATDEAVRSILAPGAEDRATCPSERFGLSRCGMSGSALAYLAYAALAHAPSASIFVAQEAHYLIAAAWSGTLPAGNPAGRDPGFDHRRIAPWLDAIELCRDAYDVMGETKLHADYGTWLDTAAGLRDDHAVPDA